MSVTTHSRPAGCCGTPACTCAACQGLTALVRPRFFAGQVLTETDLMALERYAVDAHRLHNRYLHGAGVVCGLELACEECGDGVVLHPGYGLDACGRDLVVPEPQHVDVARMIRDCVAAERGDRRCEPPVPGPPEGCDDDQRWCITLRHRDWPMRPVTPLGATRRKAAAACSCNGNGNGHSHTATSVAGTATATACGCGCTEYVASPDLPPGCEPTRVVECFELGIHRCEGDCCTLADALEGSFPLRALECLKVLRPVVSRGISRTSQTAMVAAFLGRMKDRDATRIGLCELYNAIVDIYTRDPLRTLCQLPPELQEIDCSEQGEDETREAYGERLIVGVQGLMLLVVAYLHECLCRAINPPCPDPCDDRITLGCVTFRDGKVFDICNLRCREYAGSFVSQRYWLPLVPAVVWILGVLCCFPLVGRTRKGRIGLARMMDSADPTGNLRRLIVEDDFAVAKSYRERAMRTVTRIRPTRLREKVTPSDEAVNLATLEGAKSADATKALRKAKVEVETVAVETPEDVPVTGAVLPVAEPGEKLLQYVHEGRVVAYARVRSGGS